LSALAGETDIFIYPGYAWRATDALMTNFHLPKSTLMMLVSALMGRDRGSARSTPTRSPRKYRFFSYGDASLLFRRGSDRVRDDASPAV
jgi:S-adenosylmethionine:tRNA ribosyltransferase-isomerase